MLKKLTNRILATVTAKRLNRTGARRTASRNTLTKAALGDKFVH